MGTTSVEKRHDHILLGFALLNPTYEFDCEKVREYIGLRNETQQFIRENK